MVHLYAYHLQTVVSPVYGAPVRLSPAGIISDRDKVLSTLPLALLYSPTLYGRRTYMHATLLSHV